MSKGDIHTRLKTARKAAGFNTAIEFCNTHKIPISTYNMHETGRRKLTLSVAERYAELLHINPAWLITGIGSAYSKVSESHDSTNLNENEYREMLKYRGNKKITKQPIIDKNAVIQVNPTLFCKIVISLVNVFKDHSVDIDADTITHYAVEIYQDIIQSNESAKDQLMIVNYAINQFRKQLNETMREMKKSELK